MQLLRPAHGLAAAASLAAAIAWAAHTAEPFLAKPAQTGDVDTSDNTVGSPASLEWTDYMFALLDSPLCFAVREFAVSPWLPAFNHTTHRLYLLHAFGFSLLHLFWL